MISSYSCRSLLDDEAAAADALDASWPPPPPPPTATAAAAVAVGDRPDVLLLDAALGVAVVVLDVGTAIVVERAHRPLVPVGAAEPPFELGGHSAADVQCDRAAARRLALRPPLRSARVGGRCGIGRGGALARASASPPPPPPARPTRRPAAGPVAAAAFFPCPSACARPPPPPPPWPPPSLPPPPPPAPPAPPPRARPRSRTAAARSRGPRHEDFLRQLREVGGVRAGGGLVRQLEGELRAARSGGRSRRRRAPTSRRARTTA